MKARKDMILNLNVIICIFLCFISYFRFTQEFLRCERFCGDISEFLIWVSHLDVGPAHDLSRQESPGCLTLTSRWYRIGHSCRHCWPGWISPVWLKPQQPLLSPHWTGIMGCWMLRTDYTLPATCHHRHMSPWSWCHLPMVSVRAISAVSARLTPCWAPVITLHAPLLLSACLQSPAQLSACLHGSLHVWHGARGDTHQTLQWPWQCNMQDSHDRYDVQGHSDEAKKLLLICMKQIVWLKERNVWSSRVFTL